MSCDVALDGGHHDRPRPAAGAGPLGLQVRHQDGHGLLHHARALDDLRQEHAAGSEQVADDVHAGHQGPLDHVERAGALQPRLLRVGHDPGVDPGHQGVGQPLGHRLVAPGQVLLGAGHAPAVGIRRGQLQQPLGRVGPAIQDDVLHPLPELRLDVVVDGQDAGVDDGHVQAGPDGVVQEHRVDRLADAIVAAEGERHVGHAAGGRRAGERLLQPADGLDERRRRRRCAPPCPSRWRRCWRRG